MNQLNLFISQPEVPEGYPFHIQERKKLFDELCDTLIKNIELDLRLPLNRVATLMSGMDVRDRQKEGMLIKVQVFHYLYCACPEYMATFSNRLRTDLDPVAKKFLKLYKDLGSKIGKENINTHLQKFGKSKNIGLLIEEKENNLYYRISMEIPYERYLSWRSEVLCEDC